MALILIPPSRFLDVSVKEMRRRRAQRNDCVGIGAFHADFNQLVYQSVSRS
jgi:hypothetical protein